MARALAGPAVARRASVRIHLAVSVIAVLSLLAQISLAQSPICGDGVTDPGEQCDVADTLSGVDECDGCHTDCTVTAECGLGPCTDNVDNDGNGLADEKDPKCSSLKEYSTFAVSGSNAKRTSVRVGAKTRIAESALAAGASICSRIVDMRSMATVAGSIVATDKSKFSHRQSSSIGGKFVTTTGATPSIPWAPALVGPDQGTCSVSSTLCLSPLDCAERGEECLNRPKLNAVNPAVDLSGTGAGIDELARCSTVFEHIENDTSLLALTGPPLGKLRLGPRGTPELTLNLGSGATVLNYESIVVGVNSVLTINGPRRATLIIRVAKRLAFLAYSRVELIGGIEPENVLWMVTGPKGVVLIDHDSIFQGFLWAPKRSIMVDSRAQMNGSIAGRQVRIGRKVSIEHHPFLSLLPSSVSLSVTTNPVSAVASAPLTYDVAVTNNGPGYAVVANLTFDLDPRTSFVSADPSQGLCLHDGSASGGTLTCFLGDLADPPAAPANQANVSIVVTVGADATQLDASATLSHTIAPNGTVQVVPITTLVAP